MAWGQIKRTGKRADEALPWQPQGPELSHSGQNRPMSYERFAELGLKQGEKLLLSPRQGVPAPLRGKTPSSQGSP
jgi:hypothetical protein